MDRPNKTFKLGKYSSLDDFCYAEFLAYYILGSKFQTEENDNQPEVLYDDIEGFRSYSKSIPLMSSKEKMKCRTVKKVLRYYTPNPLTHSEAYAHHLLMLFYPFRNENELISETSSTYLAKLNEENVNLVVNENKQKFEPWGDLVHAALVTYTIQPKTDNFAQQENDDVGNENQQNEDEHDNSEDVVDFQVDKPRSCSIRPTDLNLLPDNEINTLIASLNEKQKSLFDVVNTVNTKTS